MEVPKTKKGFPQGLGCDGSIAARNTCANRPRYVSVKLRIRDQLRVYNLDQVNHSATIWLRSDD